MQIDCYGFEATSSGFCCNELVGCAFDSETRDAMREFFDTAYWC